GVDVKILSVKRTDRKSDEVSVHSKIRAIETELLKEDLVGSPELDRPYIAGTLPLRAGGYGWTHRESPSPIAFWSNTFDSGLALAFAGSRYHLVGEQRSNGAHSHSLTDVMVAWFLQNLAEDFQGATIDSDDEEEAQGLRPADIANATFLAASQMQGPVQAFSFLAKVLHRSEWPEDRGFRASGIKRIVLASPIYVALAE
ncbi:MAG TPA: SAVMC3_10250 family protein, partial [Allosphingosinicella sp.]